MDHLPLQTSSGTPTFWSLRDGSCDSRHNLSAPTVIWSGAFWICLLRAALFHHQSPTYQSWFSIPAGLQAETLYGGKCRCWSGRLTSSSPGCASSSITPEPHTAPGANPFYFIFLAAPRGLRDLSRPGIEPGPPRWKPWILTTRPPGKSANPF